MPDAKSARTTPSRNLRLLSEEEVAQRRPVLLAGIDQFNGGYFFQAHETLEELWLVSPLPTRTFLQGIIQTAAAFVHMRRREYAGTVRLLGHALAKLETFPGEYMGIDVARLVTETRAARDELLALGPERFEEWDNVPAIHLLDVANV